MDVAAFSATVPVLPEVITGASLISVKRATFTFTCTSIAEASKPSQALTVKALIELPLFAGVQTRLSPMVRSVTPTITGTPFLVKIPLLTVSMRKERAFPSASNSFDAAARFA